MTDNNGAIGDLIVNLFDGFTWYKGFCESHFLAFPAVHIGVAGPAYGALKAFNREKKHSFVDSLVTGTAAAGVASIASISSQFILNAQQLPQTSGDNIVKAIQLGTFLLALPVLAYYDRRRYQQKTQTQALRAINPK
tara:strand:+ start:135 stop:545 length:411 start_codon:yes stop_codon:yes gene_type:complete